MNKKSSFTEVELFDLIDTMIGFFEESLPEMSGENFKESMKFNNMTFYASNFEDGYKLSLDTGDETYDYEFEELDELNEDFIFEEFQELLSNI